jgi:hypothetical protein
MPRGTLLLLAAPGYLGTRGGELAATPSVRLSRIDQRLGTVSSIGHLRLRTWTEELPRHQLLRAGQMRRGAGRLQIKHKAT